MIIHVNVPSNIGKPAHWDTDRMGWLARTCEQKCAAPYCEYSVWQRMLYMVNEDGGWELCMDYELTKELNNIVIKMFGES